MVSGGLPGYAFAFSAPAGYPVSGRPTYVSWKGTLVPFQFSDSSGTDYYNFFSFEAQSLGSIAIDGQGNVTPSSTLPGGAGIFHPNGDITGPDNVIGLDMNGNPLGSPGVVAFFGAPDGSGQSIMLEDGSARGPTFQFPRPDGSFGVKYSGLAEGQYFIMANASGSYHSSDASPIYQFHGPNQGGGDISIGAVATGWTLSNILPPQLYVNGLGVQLTAPAQDWWHPADQDPNGNPSRGGSAYYYGYGTGGSGDVSVSWNWSQAFSGISYTARTWGYPGGRFSSCGGIWSGGTEFINQSGTAVVSLTPPPVPWSTRFGPSSIQWNSRVLTFDRDASTMSPLNPRGADVYLDAAGYRIEIAPDHHVTVYYPNETTARYSGSYLPSQLQFDFGSQHFGTVLALDPNGDPIGTSSSGNISFAGDLDVQGNHFTLGTWTDSAGNSVNGLGLSYRDAIGSSPPQIRFDAMREITEWLWTRANPVAGAAPVKTMTLDSDNRLQLYPPTGVSTAKIVLDPGGVSEFKGVLRVYEHGDISMGEFKNPPMAP